MSLHIVADTGISGRPDFRTACFVQRGRFCLIDCLASIYFCLVLKTRQRGFCLVLKTRRGFCLWGAGRINLRFFWLSLWLSLRLFGGYYFRLPGGIGFAFVCFGRGINRCRHKDQCCYCDAQNFGKSPEIHLQPLMIQDLLGFS